MKRSSNLRLTLMAAAIPAALSGCEPAPPTGAVVTSVQDCIATSGLSAEQCQAGYDEATAEHGRVAPRFQNRADCNEEFGNCTPVEENGRSSWIPPMTGFLVGYALGGGFEGNRNQRQYGYAGASPLYRNYRNGDYLKPSGDLAARQPGTVTGARGNTATPARAITVSRAGFGSRAAARSSFGRGG